jgi:NADPH:quinone reductase-like Zn-dependent oxidoreductase
MVAKGILVSNGGGSLKENEGSWLGPITGSIAALALSPFMSQKMVTILASITNTDLTALTELMDAGKVKPVIDKCYKLTEVPQAIRYLEEGHARGKVVITVGQSSKT